MQRLHQLCRDGVGGLFAVHKHEGLRGLKLIILLQFYDALGSLLGGVGLPSPHRSYDSHDSTCLS